MSRSPGRGPRPARAAARPGSDRPSRPSTSPRDRASSSARTRSAPRRQAGHRLEVTFLPGLGPIVADEVQELLAPPRPPRPVPGRDDALELEHTGRLARALELRTAVAVFLTLTFDVPRPKSLTSGEHLPRLVDAMHASVRLGARRTFRFEAAGRDSAVFVRLAAQLAEATGLVHDDVDGEVVLRFRRTPGRSEASGGWDVLVRLGGRPLSARDWRVTDYPGAVNATIAAAMVRLTGVREHDRVANLMCGSGTLLVERLLAGPARSAVGVDLAPDAVAATVENLEAAGLAGRATVRRADVTGPARDWAADGPFDVVLADPPWGTLHGSHASSGRLHTDLLRTAHEILAPGGLVAVLTHEVKVMEQVLRAADASWRVREEIRVFAKGHHPRIYLLAST